MGFRVTRLEAAGFRGVNTPLDLPLLQGLTVISGGNGTGKSSILQAVEWALFGALPESGNSEFRREDAIVNAFSSAGRAKVRLTLADGDKILVVERLRRLGRSTTARSDLLLRSGGEVWRGDAAQEALGRLLRLTAAEYHSAVHLRQDASRSLATAEREERAVTIDRLLGIAALRDLAENLALPQVSREVHRLAQEIAAGRDAGLTTAIEMRRLLTQQEAALQARQINTAHLSARALEALLARLEAELTAGLAALGLPAAAWPATPAAHLAESRRRLALCRTSRDERVGQVHAQLSQLAVASARLEAALATGPAMGDDPLPPEELRAELATIDAKLAAARQRQERERSLRHEESELSAALSASEQRLQQLVGAEGDGEPLQTLQRLQRDLEALEIEGKRLRGQARLLADAAELLEDDVDRCPVCGQSLAPAGGLLRLRTEVAANDEARRLEELRQRYRRLDEQRRRLLEVQTAQAAARSEVATRRERLSAVRAVHATADSSDNGAVDLTPAILALEDRRAELRLLARRQEERRNGGEARRAALVALASLLGAPSGATPPELLRLAQERNAALNGEIAFLEQWGVTATHLDADLQEAAAVSDFLDLRNNVERLAAEHLGKDDRRTVVETKHSNVQRFQNALQAIRTAALAVSEERLQRALDTVVPAANRYFDRMGGHPAYAALTLQPQMQRGSSSYALLAHDAELQHATFLPTRLSHTQMHVAALAMF
ncbi:MAG TPA: AAA family ATPase, partial [Chloroflexota bacterium]|nr:AAA family ATPase [Chloroflexota bacterium]